MKVLVSGSRSISDETLINRLLSEIGEFDEMIVGDAEGVDRIALGWAKKDGKPFRQYKADWKTYGRSAGFRRNVEMLSLLSLEDIVLVIWDGESPGSNHMRRIAKDKGLKVCVWNGKTGVFSISKRKE